MDLFLSYIEAVQWEIVVNTVLRLILILLITWVALKVLNKLLSRLHKNLTAKGQQEGEPPSEVNKRIDTLIRLVRQAAKVSIGVAVGLIILREIGVDIAPILAGAGILGLAVGFGAQNLVRDIISGFFFILENQVRVGDVAIVNGTGGMVEEINFRTLILRDLGGVVHTFPNGTITTLSNMTKEWSAYVFEVGVAYKENTDRVCEVIKEVCDQMRKEPAFGPSILDEAEIFGVDKFGDSSVIIKGRIKTKPIRQWAIGREFLRRTKLAFDERGIEIPFPHQTIYFGEASKPFDIRLLEKFGGNPTEDSVNVKKSADA